MSERDEHIALLEQALANIENDYTPTCIQAPYGNGCPGATDASRDFWRRAVDVLPSLLAELRALRLTAADREALEALALIARGVLQVDAASGVRTQLHIMTEEGLSVLSKLLGQGGGK